MTQLAPAVPALPQTIDQVIQRLNDILDDALRSGARIGYFAALYKELVSTPPDGWAAVIAARDAHVAALGRALYPLPGLFGDVQKWIHAAESADVRFNIQVVAE